MSLRYRASALALVSLASVSTAKADPFAFFAPLGPPVPILAVSTGLSGDGTTVVGQRDFREAFYWTPDDGVVGLDVFSGGSYSYATAVNFDGSIIVGLANTPTSPGEAFRWTKATGLVGLGFLPGGNSSAALGINYSGRVIVGRSNTPTIQSQAFRWTQATGMVGLPLPDASIGCEAVAVSADGNNIAGTCSNIGQGVLRSWFWRVGAQPISMGIPTLAPLGPGLLSNPTAISADGRFVVGADTTASNLGAQPYKWRVGDAQVTALGHLPGGVGGQANAINADGSVIVGAASNATRSSVATRWTDLNGAESVEDLLIAGGTDLGGWGLASATGVSADGSIICGNGFAGGPVQAWCAKIGTGFISADTLNTSLQSIAAIGEIAFQDLSDDLRVVMNVARHYDRAVDTGTTSFWGGAVAEKWDNDLIDRNIGFGLAGFSHQASADWRVGAGLRYGRRTNDLVAFESEATGRSWGANAFAAYQPADSRLRGYVAGIAARVTYDITRGYLNGIEPTSSEGEYEGSTYGAAAVVGYLLGSDDGFSLTPFAGYSVQHLELDAYTEATGPFPAHFDDFDGTLQISRLGAEARLPLNDSLAVWASAGWGHRFEDKLPDITGEVLLLASPFVLQGASVSQDWAEGSAGFGWHVNRDIALYVDVGATTDGHTVPTTHANLGVQIRL